MSKISVTRKECETQDNYLFSVEVDEGGSATRHEIAVEEDDYKRLTPEGVPVEELVEESFRFLLEREPKGSILSSFDITVIGN
ncbi:MAG: hypothetical protein ACOC6I_00955 [Candidatus Bipolaricaulota bacterium]